VKRSPRDGLAGASEIRGAPPSFPHAEGPTMTKSQRYYLTVCAGEIPRDFRHGGYDPYDTAASWFYRALAILGRNHAA